MENFENFYNEYEETLLAATDEQLLSDEFRENVAINAFEKHFNTSIKDVLLPRVCKYVAEKSVELSERFVNIAPYGDFSKLTYNKSEIAKFLAEEGSKPENWQVHNIAKDSINNVQLVKITFFNKSIDPDDKEFQGFVFINNSSKIRFVCATHN